MPPKADYWKYFNVVGVVAYCLVAQCEHPPISLGAPPISAAEGPHLAPNSQLGLHLMWFQCTAVQLVGGPVRVLKLFT